MRDVRSDPGSPTQIADPSAERGLKLCLFGCAPDTGNLGVSALCLSTVSEIKREVRDAVVTVFDHGRGYRWGATWMGDRALTYALCGGRYSHRIHEAESLANIRFCCRLGGLGNPGAMTIAAADALLDISGGDSFTDLYGQKRFRSVIYPKRMALELGIPLILLPQTYGPFRSPRNKRIAGRIVLAARMAWARDARSFESLKDLLGADFDPTRYRCGVDVAFGLDAKRPRPALYDPLLAWLGEERNRPVIGFNVSGLIYNTPRVARERYALKADYVKIVEEVLSRLLRETSAKVLLVPHVRNPEGDPQGDLPACRAVRARIAAHALDRVMVVDGEFDPSEVKYIIANTDWFCGTRMHSTIAALSSGVPAAAVAYSGKTLGVFETCGQGQHVADPREMDTEAVCDRVWRSWCERDRARTELRQQLPTVLEMCRQQMLDVLEVCACP